jgi:predicted N-acyltransferase
VALYVRDDEIDDFTAEGNGLRSALAATLSVAHTEASGTAFLSALTSKQRRTVRRDRERLARSTLRYEVMPARAALDVAPELVVNVKRRHGVADHPKLARLRLTEWAEEDVGERLAYVVSDNGQVVAVSFGVSYGGRLEVYETGLVDEHEFRHEAYVQSMIYGPLEHAMILGLTSIELGLDSLTPKTSRGAVPVPVWAAG